MLVTPYGIAATKPAGTSLLTPNIVAVQKLVADTAADWSSQTFRFDSTNGNIVVLFSSRSNAADPLGFEATWAGDALTESLDLDNNRVGGALGWAGWIRGGATGEQDLIITAGGSKQRDLLGWAFMFDRLAETAIGATAGAPVVSVQSAYGFTLNVTNAASRLLGLVAAMHDDLSPFSLSAGWTRQETTKSGNAGTGDIAAVSGHRLAGATGNITMTATSTAAGPPTTDDWVSIGLEVLPA